VKTLVKMIVVVSALSSVAMAAEVDRREKCAVVHVVLVGASTGILPRARARRDRTR